MTHEERNTDKAGGNTTIGKQKTPQKVRGRIHIVPFRIGGRMRKQFARGWTEELCRYLDYPATIDISYDATWEERSRCEHVLVLELNDGTHPGRTTSRNDFPPAARMLASLGRLPTSEKQTRTTTTI